MYVNFALGSIYALIITFRNRYGDRYEEAEYKRLTFIKAYVASCMGSDVAAEAEKDQSWGPLIISMVFLVGFIGLLYWAFNML